MSSFDHFETAQKLQSIIDKSVRNELQRQRPKPKYAVVQSIDPDTRSCMVQYLGEDVSVKIPYTDTAPSEIGQEVRIEGTQSDRYISGVRGTSDAELRIETLEAALDFHKFKAYAYARPTGDYSFSNESVTRLNSITAATNMSVDANGRFIAQVRGIYAYDFQTQVEPRRNNQVTIFAKVLQAGGGAVTDNQAYMDQLSGSSEYTSTSPMNVSGLVGLEIGEAVYSTHSASNSTTCHAWGTRGRVMLVERLP
jgi:hypothetical protein